MKRLRKILSVGIVILAACSYGEGNSNTSVQDAYSCNGPDECAFNGTRCSHVSEPGLNVGDILDIVPDRTPCLEDQECLCLDNRCEYDDSNRDLFDACLVEMEECRLSRDGIERLIQEYNLTDMLDWCTEDCEDYPISIDYCSTTVYLSSVTEGVEQLEQKCILFTNQDCCRFYPY